MTNREWGIVATDYPNGIPWVNGRRGVAINLSISLATFSVAFQIVLDIGLIDWESLCGTLQMHSRIPNGFMREDSPYSFDEFWEVSERNASSS